MGNSNSKKSEKSFWETVPGIITAIAGLISAIGGCIVIVFGVPQIADRLFPPSPTPIVSPPPSDANIVNSPTSPPTAPPTTESPALEKTPISNQPKVFDFQTCESLCNGQNGIEAFAGGIKKIYAQFNYDNFQPDIKYVRTWSMNGMEWIRYSCNWDGPISGTEVLTLKEPKGLHSGTWQITILVNDKVVLSEEITITGNWTYWDPAGTINACHGTTD